MAVGAGPAVERRIGADVKIRQGMAEHIQVDQGRARLPR